MTLQELHQTFATRAKGLNGFIYNKTNGNEDMRQEAMLAMWRGLQIDPDATDAFLRTRIRWKVRDEWKRGASVDTHYQSRTETRFNLLNDGDIEDEIMAECMRDTHLPLDEQVAAKVDSERFLNTLSSTEKAIVVAKVYGLLDDEISKNLGMSVKRYRRLKAAIRPKIEDFFGIETDPDS